MSNAANRRRLIGASAAGVASVLAPSVVRAQSGGFPSKPIRVVVPFNAGSGSDSASRAYAEVIARQLGQPVVVENRPGGSGLVAIQIVKQAPADGHTLLLGSTSPMCVMPVLNKSLPYDPFKDFRPVHGLSYGGATFVVKGDSPHNGIAEFMAAARKEGRVLNVGNYSDGYMLVATWLGAAAGVKINHVSYKGGQQGQNDVVVGQLDLAVNDSSGIVPLWKAGKIKPLAITSGQRDPKYPELRTMVEQGFEGFETYVFAALVVRAETPDDITVKLADAVRTAMHSPEGKAYQAANSGTPMLMHTKELGDFLRRDYERFKKVAEMAGIQPS